CGSLRERLPLTQRRQHRDVIARAGQWIAITERVLEFVLYRHQLCANLFLSRQEQFIVLKGNGAMFRRDP
ncbi:MAG TPA: hypothetical protein VIG36_06170, partial [Methylocystis sp.]